MKKLLLFAFFGTQLFSGISAEWKSAIISQLFANQRGLTSNEERYTSFVLDYIQQIEQLPATTVLMSGSKSKHLYRYRDLLINIVTTDFNMRFAGFKKQPLFKALQESLTALIKQAAEENDCTTINAEEQVRTIVTIIHEANNAYYKKLVPFHKKMIINVTYLFLR